MKIIAMASGMALALSATAGGNLQPLALFRKLQAVPLRSSELPPGFRLPPPAVGAHPGFPTSWSPSHAIPWRPGGAELAFAVSGRDRIDLIGYTVYRTPKLASAALLAGPGSHRFGFAPANAALVGSVPGSAGSTIWRVRVSGLVVVEADIVVAGFVEVRSLTVSDKAAVGDLRANFLLVRAGVSHLAAVER